MSSSEETCDRIIEENCEYSGEVIYEAPPGSIRTPEYCQALCAEFARCVDWSYIGGSKICYLYDSDERMCQGLGGPQQPSITECMNR